MRHVLVAAALILAACSSAPKPALETLVHPGLESEPTPRTIPEPSPEELSLAERAVEEAVRHWGLQAESVWEKWVGRGAPEVEAAPDFLFRAETILAVERAAVHAAASEARRRYARVHAFLAGAFLDQAVAALDEEIGATHRRLLAEGPGIASASDPGERARAGRELLDATEALIPLLRAREEAFMRALASLEHEDAFEVRASLAGGEPEALLRLAASILQATDSLWTEALADAALRELGLPLPELGWMDLPRIFRGAGLDIPVRAKGPEEALARTLAGLEIELEGVDGLTVERVGVESRSLCLPTPGGARLAIPQGGGSSHRDLFRDVGCALAAARVDSLPPEFLLRGFGGLFAQLTTDPDWLVEVGGMTAAESRARSAAFALRRLYFVRHHAARILAEAERGRAAYEESYARHMSRALGVPVPGAASRLERADLLWAIENLRGAMLASSLRQALGPRWWADPSAKEKLHLLLAAAAEGEDALLAILGSEVIDVEPFVSEVRAALGRSEAVAILR